MTVKARAIRQTVETNTASECRKPLLQTVPLVSLARFICTPSQSDQSFFNRLCSVQMVPLSEPAKFELGARNRNFSSAESPCHAPIKLNSQTFPTNATMTGLVYFLEGNSVFRSCNHACTNVRRISNAPYWAQRSMCLAKRQNAPSRKLKLW